MNRVLIAFALCATLALGGCTTLAQGASNVNQALSSSTPQQATTLAQALQFAKLATDAVDVYVNTGNPNRATLTELNTLNEGLHAALGKLQTANMAGQSLALAVFNQAFLAFTTYETAAGVKH